MRLIILCLFLFSFASSEPIININSNKFSITDFKLSYFIDKSAKLKFKDIDSMNFIEGKNKDTLGAEVEEVWLKIKFFNTTNQKQTLFLHQSLAYTIADLEYFEVDNNNNLLNKQFVSTYDPLAQEQLNGADSIYKFTLASQETKTVYIHQSTKAYHFYNFSIFSEKESIEYLIYEKVDAVLLVGLLMALAFYNFLIFLSTKYKEYLYYSLYLVSSTLWIFYMYGSMAHYFHIYGLITFKFNYGLIFGPIFLALFIKTIFNTKTEYKNENRFLNSIIIVLLCHFIFALIDFTLALQNLYISLNYATFVFLGIAISIYRKGNEIIKIFLFAHIFYIFFNIYALLFYMGLVEYTYISSHGIGIGIVIEALLLSYLVSYKFKIMEHEKEESRIQQIKLSLLATTDSMTKLYNRRYFIEAAQNIIHLSKRKKNNLSLMMIDIDHFKSVNDTYGHQFGDDVIILLANTLKESLRETDIICRYGGEEFVILLPDNSLASSVKIAQKIKKLVESLVMISPANEDFKFTISIGVTPIDIKNEVTLKDSLKRVDDALYEAKNTGRNRVCIKELIYI